jgi:SAM-dependent methyltransferase
MISMRSFILEKIAHGSGKAISDEYITYVYKDIYSEFNKHSHALLGSSPDRVLELGAGSLSKATIFFESVILCDGVADTLYGQKSQVLAEDLPFNNEEFDAVLAKDTLHHFNDVDKALSEISRVLKTNGVFFVSEPYWSPLGRFVFKYLHPEKWVTNPLTLQNFSNDQLTANQAMLLELTSNKFSFLVKKNSLSLEVLKPTYGMSYLLSGGLNWRTRISYAFLQRIYKFERKHDWILQKITGLNIIAVFRKI